VVEAMASGTPVVATRSGGIPEAVVDGVTGLFVPFRNPQAIADALRRLAGEPQTAQRMGAQGRRQAVERFDWSRLTDQLVAIFAGQETS
jgi:glycosyltransferase involved in cell wall biosynthesis